jgi:hypothetical protein
MCPGSGPEDHFNLKIFFSIDLKAQKGFLSSDFNLQSMSIERSQGDKFQSQQFQQNFRL